MLLRFFLTAPASMFFYTLLLLKKCGVKIQSIAGLVHTIFAAQVLRFAILELESRPPMGAEEAINQAHQICSKIGYIDISTASFEASPDESVFKIALCVTRGDESKKKEYVVLCVHTAAHHIHPDSRFDTYEELGRYMTSLFKSPQQDPRLH